MTTEPKITVERNYIIGEYEPGNGTRYTAIAVPWTADPYLTMGSLGSVTDGWLVVSGNSGRAYLFQKYGTLTDEYIWEHLGGDFPYFGDLIRQLILSTCQSLNFTIQIQNDMPEDREAYYNERAELMP